MGSQMAEVKAMSSGLEWRVTVPEASSVKIESDAAAAASSNFFMSLVLRLWTWLATCMSALGKKVASFGKRIWRLGADDPRRVIHGLKVGLALTLVSLFYYTRPLYDGVGGASMWAIMTVVVVFEYTVGGCIYKGFNRAAATLSAGVLAMGIHWIASKSGHKVEPIVTCASVFLLGSAATFSRFIPIVKTKFDYGVTIFILTYSLVAISGYRVQLLLAMAEQRVSTIAIGIAICFCVCVLICPVWAGAELHNLTVRNIAKLADSLEGCIEDYFSTNVGDDGEKSPPSEKSLGFRCVLNSKGSEDSHANLARWEPAHGRFGFRHPWTQYLKVGAAIRNCAYCIEALCSCITSDTEAPEDIKKHMRDACIRVGAECSALLKEMSRAIQGMRRPQNVESMVENMSDAVLELQEALKLLPTKLCRAGAAAAAEQEQQQHITYTNMILYEALPLITVVSLLTEISARSEGVVDEVNKLASLAHLKPGRNNNNHKKVGPSNSPDQALPEESTKDSMNKAFQQA